MDSEGIDMSVARLSWALAVIAAFTAPRLAIAQSGAAGAPETIAEEGAQASASPWGWLKMPKITMPQMPADPLAPVKASGRKVADGTRRAWAGVKELLTFGGEKQADQPTARMASNPQPSMWQRMFGGAEEEPQGPQSVAEWMSQPRVE
jgi:hypothetical protein